MDDVISRQYAIDDIWTVSPLVRLDRKWVDRWLRQLPSAQPTFDARDTQYNLPIGTDLISRRAAINMCRKPCMRNADCSDFEMEIMMLPSAEPEIIRCKDCKHWIPYDWMFSEVWQSKNIADYPEDEIGCDCCDMAMKANDFCSRVERRTE